MSATLSHSSLMRPLPNAKGIILVHMHRNGTKATYRARKTLGFRVDPGAPPGPPIIALVPLQWLHSQKGFTHRKAHSSFRLGSPSSSTPAKEVQVAHIGQELLTNGPVTISQPITTAGAVWISQWLRLICVPIHRLSR